MNDENIFDQDAPEASTDGNLTEEGREIGRASCRERV